MKCACGNITDDDNKWHSGESSDYCCEKCGREWAEYVIQCPHCDCRIGV